jgi:tetratricopeptide (TPR) repeat protein
MAPPPPPPRRPARPLKTSPVGSVGAEPATRPSGSLPPAPPKPPKKSAKRDEASRAAEVSTEATTHIKTRVGVPALAAETPDAAPPAAPEDVRKDAARKTIAACVAELKDETDSLRSGRLHYEMARLFESPLGELKASAEHYEKAHELLPDHVPTMHGARRVLIREKNYQAALPLFDAEARNVSDPRKKALILLEKGRLFEDQMGQKREAREAYAAALELGKDDPTLLKAVERAELGAAAWSELDHAYERAALAVSSDTRHRAAVVVERAHLLETHKGDSQAAAELYKSALDLDPRAPGAMHALKRLLYAQQRWHDLVQLLEQEADQASDASARAMAHYRVGRVLVDRLGKLDEAVAAMERASKEAPGDSMVLEELARLYELAKRWNDLVSVLARLVDLAGTPGEKVGLQHRIGQLAEERLNDENEAVKWYGRALEHDPTYVPALQALGSLYTRAQKWQPLVMMHLNEAAQSPDATRRAAAHARVAEIFETRLSDTDQAVLHHARALGLVPGYPASFKALSRLYTQSGKYRELAELYERAVDGASDNEARVTYLFKIGRLHEDALGAPGAALSAYQRILKVEPRHMGAIHALERAAERAGRFKDLVAALELEASLLKDKQEIVALYHRAGEVCEDYLGDVDAALARYRQVVERDPRYVPALASLGRLYYKSGRWDDLLGTYRRELEVTPRGPAAAALLYRMGELCEERLGNDDEAVACYRRAVDMDPFHQPALHALGKKLSERGQWGELVKLLELELSGLKDPERRAHTAFRMGEVYENRLLQNDKALGAYEQALGAVPDFRPALDGRVRLLVQARDWKRLVEELANEAQAARDPGLAVAALLREAEIWRDELSEPQRAVQCFESILERDPAHLGALLALEQLYAGLGTWDALARVYTMQARVLTDVGARVAALRELARLQEFKNAGNPEQVRQTYFAILQLVPNDLGALFALERIALVADDRQLLAHIDAKLGAAVDDPQLIAAHHTRLAEALELAGDLSALEVYRAALARDGDNVAATRGLARIASRSEDPELLTEAAEREARVLGDVKAAAALLVRAAHVASSKKNDPARAAQALERALELYPDHVAAADELWRMLLDRGEVDRLVDALIPAAQAAGEPERMAVLWDRVAKLLADHKNDVPAALAALHRVMEQLPGHVPTLLALADLYGRDAQWAEAADRLRQVLAQAPPRDVRGQAQLKLAEILDEHLGDPARAVASLNAVLSADENNREALRRLLQIQMSRSQSDAAAATAARLVGVSAGPTERADALTHLARLERNNKQLDAASKAFEQAVSIVGLGGEAAKEFKDLLLEQKLLGDEPQWTRYVAALSRYLEQTSVQPASLAPVYLEIARVLGDELKMVDRAVATLRQGLAGASGDVGLRTELAARLKQTGHWSDAIGELRRLLEVDVMRADTWRDLCEAFRGMKRDAEVRLAVAGLVALGAANDLERSMLSARPPRPASAPAGSFDTRAFQAIDVMAQNAAVTDLLSALSESLSKIHPPELERYNLSTRDRITARSGHPLRALADEVAQIFGLTEFDLYVHRAHAGSLEVEFTDPPAILVPAHVAGLGQSQQVFLLARPLANLARGLHAVDKLAPQAIELLLAAAARNVEPGFGAALTDEEFLNAHARRVAKALSRRSRRAVEDAALAYARAKRPSIVEWAQAVRITAARAALVVSDDLPSSVTLVRRMEADLAGVQGAALAQGMALLRDLLRFWISDAALALRKKLGML